MALNLTLNGVTKDLQSNDCVVAGIRRVASTGRLQITDTSVKPNLCPGSNAERSSSRYVGISIPSATLKPNTTYSWSFAAKLTGNKANTDLFRAYHQGWQLPDGSYISSMFNLNIYSQVTGDYQRFGVTFTTPSIIPTTGNLEMSFYIGDNRQGVSLAVRRWKLEQSGYMTPYLPNEADTYNWDELTINGETRNINASTVEYQWIATGARYCSGYTLMEPQKRQTRTCTGNSCTAWADTGETQNAVIEVNSAACGYSMPSTFAWTCAGALDIEMQYTMPDGSPGTLAGQPESGNITVKSGTAIALQATWKEDGAVRVWDNGGQDFTTENTSPAFASWSGTAAAGGSTLTLNMELI